MKIVTASLTLLFVLAGCRPALVPPDFDVPKTVETGDFRIRPLTSSDAEKDFEAVMESREIIHRALLSDTWPAESFTVEEDRQQIEHHERLFERRRSFAYAVVTPDEGRVLGSVYINRGIGGPDAAVFLWVRRSAMAAGLGPVLEAVVRQWIREEWPFRWVVFPGRNTGMPAGDTAARPSTLTDGGWLGSVGTDAFLYEFGGRPDSLTGIAHWLTGGREISELPMTEVRFSDGQIEAHAPTGAVLRGPVDLAAGLIEGALSYPSGSGPGLQLRWVEPALVPGRPARAAPPDGAPAYVYRRPRSLADGWETAMPEDVGIDAHAVTDMVGAAIAGEAGVVHSLLVVRHGKLVVEEYFHGYRREDLDPIASCTKSVASLLVGIAIDQGTIPGVDVPILDFFPELRNAAAPGWESIRLEHLLTMSMALDWTDREAESVHGSGPAFFRDVLARKPAGPPGERWRYVSANVDLLAGVLRQATGVQADAFAREQLFEPLGIRSFEWEGGRTAGYPQMDGSLMLAPRDMAKLGSLVLDGGRWNGRQIVSADWIGEATAPRIAAEDGSGAYGYLWWVGGPPAPTGETIDVVWANGWGSQFILVFPTLDLVVVTTGGNQDNGKHMAIGRVLYRTLIPSLIAGDS